MVFILYNVKCQELIYWLLASYAVYRSGEITCYSFQGDEQIFVHKDYKAKFQGLLTNATNDTKNNLYLRVQQLVALLRQSLNMGAGNHITACNRYHRLI